MKTDRLNVFAFQVTPTERNSERTLYVAFLSEGDHPIPIASAVVHVISNRVPPYLDWIEVSSEFRRSGFGTELLRLLEVLHPGIEYEDATDDGAAWLDAIESSELSS